MCSIAEHHPAGRSLVSKAAQVLVGAAPESTGALARVLGVTPGAVPQHLGVLAACGLVTRRRVGGAVLYAWSELGDRLAAR